MNNQIKRTTDEPNSGCATAILLLIACVVFGLLTSCDKDDSPMPQPIEFNKECAPNRAIELDTTLEQLYAVPTL